MIDVPRGWSQELRESGLVLLPPGGWEVGGLRYAERVRPIASFAEIVRGLPVPAAWIAGEHGPVERLVTGEGEHAAMQRIDGTFAGLPLRRFVGIVLGDDFYSLLVGQSRDPARHEELEALFRHTLFGDRLALGVRRRRFDYRAPAGWQGLAADHLHAQFLPPGAPRDPSRLTVFPAFPQAPRLAADLVQTSFGQVPVAGKQPMLAGGLAGHRFVAHAGFGLLDELVVLEDATHVYALGFRGLAEHRAVFEEVVASVRPLPGRHAAPAKASFDHWL
jgi:hypothetical protein